MGYIAVPPEVKLLAEEAPGAETHTYAAVCLILFEAGQRQLQPMKVTLLVVDRKPQAMNQCFFPGFGQLSVLF